MINLTITDTDIDNLIDELINEFDGKPSFCQKRRDVLKNCNDVQACPGSGKTTLVATKLLMLSRKWTERHKGICVLTHTNIAKSVILKLLQKNPSGYKLLSYPHFVGTIQEFVNRFLGLPYLRTNYEFKRFSENNEANIDIFRSETNGFAMNDLCNKLYRKCDKASYAEIKTLLGSIHYINKDFDIGFYGQHGDIKHFKAANGSATYELLKDLKERLNVAGIFQYKDMYSFAQKLLVHNPALINSLQKRFPLVFIDEMQDTQEFQDDLLNHIFNCDDVVLQRFGDPDQAIFDGMSGEKPNESYNNAALDPIIDSHRFGNDIASKIKGLSYNRLSKLSSIRNPPDGGFPHTIFLYDNQSIKNVLDAFGNLIHDLPDDQKNILKTIKAVGGVGKEKSDGLTIKHYWDYYDKSKAPKSFKATRLNHIVRKCSEQQKGNVSENYELLIQGIVDLLRKADKKTKNREGKETYYSKTSLIRALQDNNKYDNLRHLLTTWIINDFPSQETWRQHMDELFLLLDLDKRDNKEVQDFIAYDDHLQTQQEHQITATNIYECPNRMKIEVSTIHGVKAETHDATLILETKYHKNDISYMLDFFISDAPTHPKENSLQAGFMRKLYVAASRPRHLLCLAINKNNLSQEQIAALKSKGWNIKQLTISCDVS